MPVGAAVASVQRNRRKLVFRHVFRPRHKLIHAGKEPLPVVEHSFDTNLLVVHKRHQIGQRLGVIADLQIADDALIPFAEQNSRRFHPNFEIIFPIHHGVLGIVDH